MGILQLLFRPYIIIVMISAIISVPTWRSIIKFAMLFAKIWVFMGVFESLFKSQLPLSQWF